MHIEILAEDSSGEKLLQVLLPPGITRRSAYLADTCLQRYWPNSTGSRDEGRSRKEDFA